MAGATFAYTVKGRVIQKNTQIGVSGAAVSLSTYDSGVQIINNGLTSSDGSFSIPLNDLDCKGKKMTLTATTGIQLGSTVWFAQQESETKNIEVVAVFNPNPNLRFTVEPVPFEASGQIKPVLVKGFQDEMGPPILIQSFNCTIAYDSGVFNALSVIPGPLFQEVLSVIDEGAGLIFVEGFSPMPVPLPQGDFPVDSFFDVFFELEIPAAGAETKVDILPESYFTDINMIDLWPVPSISLIKLGESISPPASVHISDYQQWSDLLEAPLTSPNIRPMFEVEWDNYMDQWQSGQIEGIPYPETTFVPASLYAYEDDGSYQGEPAPDGDGLVMAWGNETAPTGDYASAFVFDYGSDPDLTNCTIQVTVLPPSMPPYACNITAVSFAMVDVNNNRRSWWWAVPGQIPYNVATTVTINTAISGITATSPTATGYLNVPAFDITKVQSFDVDENSQWVFGTQPVPPFGTQIFGFNWNYWHNLIVRKNQDVSAYKGSYVKYSQPIVEIDNPDQTMTFINGWDEVSVLNDLRNNNLPFPQHYYFPPRIMADDWKCTDERPVTDIHWWGSFLGWTQPTPPKIVPKQFHIGIWTDVPAGADAPWSHPGKLIWENYCDSWVWNFAGYDVDPRPEPMMNETCFQFNQLLSENEWFYQKPMGYDENGNVIPNIYWLSIVPIYDPVDIPRIRYPWGWKTRPHIFMDNAVRIMFTDGAFPPSPPAIGNHWKGGEHVFLLQDGVEVSWDLAFELTTNVRPPVKSADLNFDEIVNLEDLSIFASQWLSPGP